MREDYITYEYLSINVKSDLEPMYIDCYENFGWIPINNNVKRDYYINSNTYQNIVNIKFKRDRKTKNKEELKKLQEKCEKAILTIDKLEKMPYSIANVYSLIAAFVGIIFMLIFSFIITTNSSMWFIASLCGVIGIIGLIVPYFIYNNVKNKKEAESQTKIEDEQNIIHEVCLKARKLLQEI